MRQAPLMAKVEGEEEEEPVAEASPKRTLQLGSNSFLTFPSQGEIVHPDATYKYA